MRVSTTYSLLLLATIWFSFVTVLPECFGPWCVANATVDATSIMDSAAILLRDRDDRHPLDLPVRVGAIDEEDSEDEPEIVLFYGTEYEGDGFFWCLDFSASMGAEGKIAILKAEVAQAVQSLSARAMFSVVAFNTGTYVWSERPRHGVSAAKSSASSWVQARQPDGFTCILSAGVTTIEISNLCKKRHKQIIIVGDGLPFCSSLAMPQNTLSSCAEAFDVANFQDTPINTVFVGDDPEGFEFMQQLAVRSNGRCRSIR